MYFLDILKGEGTSLGQILRKMEPNKVKWVAEKKEFDSHLQRGIKHGRVIALMKQTKICYLISMKSLT